MKKSFVGLVLLGLLTGCAVKPPSPPQETVGLVCLPLVTYTKAQQHEAGQEAQAYAKFEPQIMSMLEDYAVMREEDKECLTVSTVEDHTQATNKK